MAATLGRILFVVTPPIDCVVRGFAGTPGKPSRQHVMPTRLRDTITYGCWAPSRSAGREGWGEWGTEVHRAVSWNSRMCS
jgi:hypothetical protein